MPLPRRYRPDPCEEVSSPLFYWCTLPCGLRVLVSALGSGFPQSITALGLLAGAGLDWDLVPKHLSLTTFLLSLPISSPDETLKWQYVDQFVSESEVRGRITSDGVQMEWSSRKGSWS